jgi:predicted dinucleotide-binding enzyme/DMSO/TMAO reductase YedYZ heme-binding membrane subunit
MNLTLDHFMETDFFPFLDHFNFLLFQTALTSELPSTPDILTTIEDALEVSHIIILAIPYTAHTKFVQTFARHLAVPSRVNLNTTSNSTTTLKNTAGDGLPLPKIIVDVANGKLNSKKKTSNSNDMSIAETLQLLMKTYVEPLLTLNNNNNNQTSTPTLTPTPRIVKSFNTLSAYALGNYSPSQSSTTLIQIASNSPFDTRTISHLSRTLGFPNTIDIGNLSASREMEKAPLAFFDDWKGALWASLLTFIFFLAWVVFRYNVYSAEEFPWHHLTNQVTNKAFAALSLSLLAYTYLPGCIAETINQVSFFTSTKNALPGWLIKFLNARKQLGLLALYWGVLHTFQSYLILTPGVFPKFYDPVTAGTPHPRFTGIGEAGMFLGVIGVFLMMTQAVTSLPSVQVAMSWAEFHFIQSYLGWAALYTSTAHVVLPAYKSWMTPNKWPGGMPGTTLMSTLIPMLVCGWKFVLILVGIVKVVMEEQRSKKESRDRELRDARGLRV